MKDFLLSPEVSREMPAKAEAIRSKGEDGESILLPKHTMMMTMEEAFHQYKDANPGHKIGLTSFRKLAPANLRKVSETNRRTCLCSSCCNVALKIESLKKFIRATPDLVPTCEALLNMSKSSLGDSILCPSDKFPSRLCLDQQCSKCQNKLDDELSVLKDHENDVISWYHWEPVTFLKDDKQKQIVSCVEKRTSLEQFIAAFKVDMKSWPSHMFRATWEHTQMSEVISTISEHQAVVLMDYSENYSCLFKDEVQSGFFDQRQVTLFPCMAYYLSDNKLVRHAIIGISPELKHDAYLTKAFEDEILKLLKNEVKDLSHVIEWTDGCAAQFKCRSSMYDISQRGGKFDRNYFETSHGKSPCDGIGSVIKNSAIRAVTAGSVVINDASSLLKFGEKKLAHGPRVREKAGKKEISTWSFIYVDEVDRNRGDVSAVKGIRQFHQVRAVHTGEIKARTLSCYCQQCQKDAPGCINSSWVDNFTTLEVHCSILYKNYQIL